MTHQEKHVTELTMHRSSVFGKLVQKHFILFIKTESVETHFIVTDWYGLVQHVSNLLESLSSLKLTLLTLLLTAFHAFVC